MISANVLPQRRKIENGIVAEAASPARRSREFLLRRRPENTPRTRPRSASAMTQTNRARRSARRRACSSPSNLLDALGVGGVRAGVARRMHAGRAAERRDDQTGIVGEDGQFGESAVVERFAGGVFGEGGRGFVELRDVGEMRQQIECRRARLAGAVAASARYSRSLPGFDEASSSIAAAAAAASS